jgi:galactokinase
MNSDTAGHRAEGLARVFRAPGRINIIGEHTDYCEGLAMPAAIDRWCQVTAAPNGARRIRATSAGFGRSVEIDLDALAPRGGWADYVAGVAFILARAGVPLVGADLAIQSDVPVGAGVGSSAALEVAVARALLALAAVEADGRQVALWARAAENEFVGVPCGIMDQFTSASGVAGAALVLDCRTLEATPAPLPAGAAFLLIDSLSPHAHVQGEYQARRRDCEEAASRLGVASLREVGEADLAGALTELPPRLAKRRRHVMSENARVRAAAAALAAGDLADLGRLINQSHASLADDMEVSTPRLDRLAAIARAAPGVFGARMMGGGFGGCVIALVDLEMARGAMARIVAEFGAVAGGAPDAFICRAVAGAAEVGR